MASERVTAVDSLRGGPLEQAFADGPYWGDCTGAQLYVSVGGSEYVSWAAGYADEGRPMDGGTLLPWSCCSKILTVLALARCLDDAGLDFGDPVASVIPEFAKHGKDAVTFRHVATHTVPYRDFGTTVGARGVPTAIPFMPWNDALQVICDQALRAAPGSMVVYTSFVSWHVLAEAVARLSGTPYMAYVAELAAACGAPNVLPFLDPLLVARHSNRLASLFEVEGPTVTRAPSDLPNERIRQRSAGTGARGSATALGQLLQVLGRESRVAQRVGISDETAHRILAPSRIGIPDPLYDGEKISWGFGVCTDPRVFGFADHVSLASVNGFRSSFGLIDVESDVVISYISNGCPAKSHDFLRKLRIIRGVYVSLGLADRLSSWDASM